MPEKRKPGSRIDAKKAPRNRRSRTVDKECEDFDIWLRRTRQKQLPQGCSPSEKRAALEMYAEMHGVKPIDHPMQIKASFWPADESTDTMLAAFRAIRRRGT